MKGSIHTIVISQNNVLGILHVSILVVLYATLPVIKTLRSDL